MYRLGCKTLLAAGCYYYLHKHINRGVEYSWFGADLKMKLYLTTKLHIDDC